jgi:hypothetical protein
VPNRPEAFALSMSLADRIFSSRPALVCVLERRWCLDRGSSGPQG